MAKIRNWYNGHSPKERTEKLRYLQHMIATGKFEMPKGSCMLCNDPTIPLEPHSEDYSKPYGFSPPAMFFLCRYCHRHKLHMRLYKPQGWEIYLAHVRRGGHSSDMGDPIIKQELSAYKRALENGLVYSLKSLRAYTEVIGEEWFSNLRMDHFSIRDPNTRHRA